MVWPDLQIEIVDQGRSGTIAEADMLKLNMTGGNCFRTFSGIRNFLGFIKQGEYSFRSGNRGLKRSDDVRR